MASGLAQEAGLARLATLGIAGGGTGYGNANARIGVGDDDTAVTAADGTILGTATWKAMDATFPTSPIADEQLIHQATFAAATIANDVKEICVDNGAASHEALYRIVLDATEQATVTAVILATAILRINVVGQLQ